MTNQAMPERLPISEHVSAAVSRIAGSSLLSPDALAAGDLLAEGALCVRYGITYLGKPQLSIVPDLVVADYGEMLVGEVMWQFLMQSAHRYPRADACGLNVHGAEEMVVLKQLDFDYPYDVFVYRKDSDRAPLTRLTALIAPDRTLFPQRLLAHLPCFESLDAWRAHG